MSFAVEGETMNMNSSLVRKNFSRSGNEQLSDFSLIEEGVPGEWLERLNRYLIEHNVKAHASFVLLPRTYSNVFFEISSISFNCTCGNENNECSCFDTIWLLYLKPLALTNIAKNKALLLAQGYLPSLSYLSYYQLTFSYRGHRCEQPSR